MSMCAVKVLDAITLEERFKKALPMLTRQIEGLILLQKTRKINPDNEKRVTNIFICPFPLNTVCIYMPVHLSVSHLFRCYRCAKVEFSQAGSSTWMRKMKTRMVMTLRPWRGGSMGPRCLKLRLEFASKNSRGELLS